MNRENEIINVNIDDIIPNRFQPRLAFDEKELKELSESIKMHGIIQPLVLRRIGDKFEIIAGERRYKASVLAGLKTVPAVIMNIDDQKSAEVAVVENLQRKDLTAIEEAQSYKKILDMGYLTQESLAARMGVAQSTIANKLRLLNLTIPVKEALLHNKISERHARSLLNITDNTEQINMLNRIMNERLTVRQADEEIAKLLGKERPQNNEIKKETPMSINPNDVDIEKEKQESKDIITEYVPKDIDALLKPQVPIKPEPTVEKKEVMINPFQEIEPEIMDFELPSQSFEKPALENTQSIPKSSIIAEYESTKEPEIEQNTPINEGKNIKNAINSAREEARKIENMGFNVDTEEFDFEDMYQIIIKIKKD